MFVVDFVLFKSAQQSNWTTLMKKHRFLAN